MCTKNLTAKQYLPWYVYKEPDRKRVPTLVCVQRGGLGEVALPQSPKPSLFNLPFCPSYHPPPPTPTLHTHNSLLTISQNQPFQHYLPFYNPLHTHLLLEDMIINLSCELSPKTLRLELLHNTSHMTQRPPNRLIPTPNLFVIQLGL